MDAPSSAGNEQAAARYYTQPNVLRTNTPLRGVLEKENEKIATENKGILAKNKETAKKNEKLKKGKTPAELRVPKVEITDKVSHCTYIRLRASNQ